MPQLILLIICFAIGLSLKKVKRFPKQTPVVLNHFIIFISLPALVLIHIHDLKIDSSLIYVGAMPWIFFFLGCVFFVGIGKLLKISKKTIGCLILTGALGNTSFVGLPMIEAFYGKSGLPIGLVVDQVGSFTILSTGGIFVASLYSSGKFSLKHVIQKILLFPPFYALLIALVLRPMAYPEWVYTVLHRLGDTLAPLALISVGYQLNFFSLKKKLPHLALGLSFKLILAPLFIFVLYVWIFGLTGITTQVVIFEAAMAPMITGGIIAMENDLDNDLAAAMISLGVLISFITLPLWKIFLQAFV